MKKLKTQGKNSKLKQKTQGFGKFGNGNDQKTRGKLLKYQNQEQNITEWQEF